MKTFESLFAELSEKAATKQAGSLTVDELAKGTHFIGKKIVEEAGETWIAAEYEPAHLPSAGHDDRSWHHTRGHLQEPVRNPGPCQLKVWPFLEEKHAKNRCA